jgi:hypothetical protein
MGWMRLTLVPVVLAVTAVVLAGPACVGPATAPRAPGSPPGTGECLGAQRLQCLRRSGPPVTAPVTTISASASPAASGAPWPERGIVLEAGRDASLADASLVLDAAAGVLYALVAPATATSQYAPWTLEAVDLRTGRARRGESYQGASLALASGFLWVYEDPGPGRPLVLDEVSQETLATVRSVPMPGSSGPAGVAAGPAGSVWAGAGRTLLRVSVSTGAVLARALLPAGLELTDVAAVPGGENVYAAAVRPFPPGGAIVLEYSAGTGGLLAQFDGATLKWSGGGAWLTSLPGGVWVSFRDGMGGESGLLTARSLSVISGFPTYVSTAESPVTGPGTVYSWFSDSVSAYAGGALWVATPGLVACVNPVTGQVRAAETAPSAQPPGVYAVAADRAARQVVAVIAATSGTTGVMTIRVVTITPPRDCWR